MLVNRKRKIDQESSPYFGKNEVILAGNEPSENELNGAEKILRIENQLSKRLNALRFGPPIEFVYNPLEYAYELHSIFVRKYFTTPTKKIMFLGMNPGPWGMSQTGVGIFKFSVEY